ncbi:MAG: UbiD family decarboxylase [Nitrososphaeria archaeon]
MHAQNLRTFVERLKSSGFIKDLGKADRKFEIAALEKKNTGPIMVKPTSGIGFVVSNLVSSEDLVSLALSTTKDDIHERFLRAVDSPKQVRPAEFPRSSYREISSKDIPAVWHFEEDLGYYMTSSIVIAGTPDGKTLNASVHRIRMLDDGNGVIRMVEGRHLHAIWNAWRDLGKDTPVAVVVGVHPAVELAAAYQAPYGRFEMEIANSMVEGLEFFRSPIYGLPVPEGDYIIEGRISRDRTDLDKMVEMLGNYDYLRKQPVLNVEAVYSKPEPLYWDVLPGGREHKWLMGFPVEAKLNREVKSSVPSVKRVYLTEGGSKWLHAVVQIKKRLEGEPVNAIIAAFAAHPSLKLVIVVDDDIDPADPVSVEYALATRFQASRGLLVIRNAKGSSLDPSSNQELLLTDKLGIDATIPLTAERARYSAASIPGEDRL